MGAVDRQNSEHRGEDVTATLREVVGRALYDIGCGPEDGSDEQEDHDFCLYLADELIERLGMTLVDCRICGCVDGGPCEDGFDHEYLYSLSPREATDG